MISAERNPLFDAFVFRLVRRGLRKQFHRVRGAGLRHLSQLPADRAVIGLANHTNWWDGFLIHGLSRLPHGKKFFCMMEEKQLRHYRFFARMGAFSVDPDNTLRAAASLHYAVRLMQRPDTLLWIFPQGTMTAPHEPIVVKPGTAFLAKKNGKSLLLPVTFHYTFFREQRPEALLRFGAPIAGHLATDGLIQSTLQNLHQQVLEDCRSGNFADYEEVIPPGISLNKLWEKVLFKLGRRREDFASQN